MLENGFEHRQYSGYASIESMEDKEIALFASRLNEKFAWLKDCVQEFDVTDIGEQHSLAHIFQGDKTLTKDLELSENSRQTKRLKK